MKFKRAELEIVTFNVSNIVATSGEEKCLDPTGEAFE